jgi:DNA-binding transcriptional ArsR family regulator
MGLRHVFGDKPIPCLLDFLLVHRFWDYPISELAKATGVSYRTLQAILPALSKNGIVRETRVVGNAKFYAINMASEAVKKLDAFAVQADIEFGLSAMGQNSTGFSP